MDGINLSISLDVAQDGWIVRCLEFQTLAREFIAHNTHGAYLVIFIDNNDGLEPVYRVRTTQHLSIYQHLLGFRWVHQAVQFTNDWDVLVDGRQYRPQ